MANKKITKNSLICEILEQRPDAVDILISFGFHCLGCPSAQMETLEEACIVHDIDVKAVLKALNK